MTLSFVTHFDINLRKFRIQDTSSYSGQGVLLSNVKGVLKLVTPRGITYNNTNYNSPDTTPAISLFSGYIDLPHNAQGFILAGAYSVQYSVLNTGDNSISSQTNSYTYNFIVPEITVDQIVDGYNSTFTSTDTTNYGTYSSLTRTHEVTPPSGSPLSIVSNNSTTISYSPNIWSGVWVTQITSILTYIQGDGLVLDVSLSKTISITAFLNDMNIIRNYIESLKLLYETSRATSKDMAYRIQASLLKITTAYSEYDLALYYNDLQTAYLRTIDITTELSDFITISFPEEIVPFINHGGGTGHPPVSIGSPSLGASINASQVLSFSLSSVSHGGMMPQLSGNTTDFLGGDGAWYSFVSGDYALKSEFTAYDSVRAITGTEITNWNTAFGWGNHAVAGYAIASNYYTKTNLQASGQSAVHWGNITNHPNTVSGYGILDAMEANTPITASTHTKITYDAKGLVINGSDLISSDIPNLPWSKITSGLPTTLAGYGIVDSYTSAQILLLTWPWSSITDTPTTLAGYGITDAYTSTQVDAKTWSWLTAITDKPTTLSGYGITDALSTSHPANNVINSGLGNLFLADDNTYKSPTIGGVSDTQIVFIDGTATSGSANLTWDKTTNTLSALNSTIGTETILTQLNFVDATMNIVGSAGDLIFTDTHFSKTLSQLVSGATNFWIASGSDIYFGAGTDKVGINNSVPTEALDVVGNIIATDFSSQFLRYKNSNLLLGPNAGDDETGSNLLYIANTNTATPLIFGDFLSQTLIFNADVYVNQIKRLNFGSSDVYMRRDSSDNLIFRDLNANGGAEISLTDITTLTAYALKSDFTSYTSVTSITAANKTTWNKASVIVTSGPGTNFLADDGTYQAVGGGGVTPTDDFAKWDTGSNFYRFYSSKTEAGGVASGGKFYLGTTDPTNLNRLNYDGYLYSKAFIGTGGIVGFNTTGYALYGAASGSGTALIASSTTGISGIFNNAAGNTSDITKFQLNGIDQCVINTSGINLITGATYKVDGVNILTAKQDVLVSGTNIKTVNGSTLLGSGDLSVAPVDGIFDWDGTAYNPYSSSGAGKFDNSSTDPTHTNRLNYDGRLHTFGFTSHSSVSVSATSATGLTSTSDNDGIVGVSTANYSGVWGSAGTGGIALKATVEASYGLYINQNNNSPSLANGYSYIFINRATPSGTRNLTSNFIEINDNPLTSGTISGSVLTATIGTTVRMNFNPRETDGAGNCPYIFDTHNNLTTSGTLLSYWKNQGVPRSRIGNTGLYEFTAGTSSTFVRALGVLKDFYVDVSTSGTGETDLYTYTIPASVLAVNGDKLLFESFLDCTSVPTSSIIKVYFAGTSTTIVNSITLDGVDKIKVSIIRVSSSVCRLTIEDTLTSGLYGDAYAELTSKDWTATNILKITGQCATNSIVAKFGHINYEPSALN